LYSIFYKLIKELVMQIDFHHATTYVLARLAGFEHPDASIVAYSAQYVDDATNTGVVHFTNGAMYRRVNSAHKMVDYRNFKELANHQVWIPFHFLPGNGLKTAGDNPKGSFIEKIICKPNSFVAKDMVRACIKNKNRKYSLHRLGITMHVYADTWAHHGFAGVNHPVNNISHLDDSEESGDSSVAASKLGTFFGDLFDKASSQLIGDTFPLGHGAALSCPDKPYLRWSYIDHNDKKVSRDNTKDFLKASDELCKAMQRYRIGDPDASVSGLLKADKDKIKDLFESIRDDDGEDRHEKWLKYIAKGHFSFPAVNLKYIAKGKGSWKYKALNTKREADLKGEEFIYKPIFLDSDWKLFHDALQAHHFEVIHDILPRYGICAA